MTYNWNWSVIFQVPYSTWILEGLMFTLLISVAAWLIAFFVGSGIGVLRHYNHPVWGKFASAYVSIFRNIPLLVQMFLWFYVLPEVLPRVAGVWLKRELAYPHVWTAIICLGFYTSVRIAEQVRAGLGAIGRRQREAALSIGMTEKQSLLKVLLPVTYRLQMPVLANEASTIIKNSSVALTIGVLELTAQARRVEEYTFQGIEAFSAVTVIYVLLTTTVIVVMSILERRYRVVM